MSNRKDTYTVEEYKSKILKIGDLKRQKELIDKQIEDCNTYIKGFENYHKSIVNSSENMATTPKQISIPTFASKKSRAEKVLELLEEANKPLLLREIIIGIMKEEGKNFGDEKLFRTLEKSLSGVMKVEVDKNGKIRRTKNENNKWVYYLALNEI